MLRPPETRLLARWGESSFLEVLDRHLQQVFDAILIGTFERLYGAYEREGFFDGVEGGLVIWLWHG